MAAAAAEPLLKHFNRAPQPLRSLLCPRLEDLPLQWDPWLADARSSLAAHSVLLDNLTTWVVGTAAVLGAQDDAIFLRALRQALNHPGTLAPQPLFAPLLSLWTGTGQHDGVQLWKALHTQATAMTLNSPILLHRWQQQLSTLHGLLQANAPPPNFSAWSGFGRSAYTAYARDDGKKTDCLRSVTYMLTVSPSTFAQQVRQAVALHLVTDLSAVFDSFTSIAANYASIGLTVPAQLLALQQPAPHMGQDPYFTNQQVQQDGWQPQPMAFFAPLGSAYSPPQGMYQQGFYSQQQPPAPAHTPAPAPAPAPVSLATSNQDVLLALLTRVLDRDTNNKDKRTNKCVQCGSTTHQSPRFCKTGPCYFCGAQDHGQANCQVATRPNQPADRKSVV